MIEFAAAKCPRCDADVYRLGSVAEDRLCEACEPQPLRAQVDLVAQSRVPKRYRLRCPNREAWNAHFKQPWPQALEDWQQTPRPALLAGKTGTGKTSAATVLLLEAIAAGHSALWIRHQRMIQVLRGSMGLRGEMQHAAEASARRFLALAESVDVLLVDDLFAGSLGKDQEVSPWVRGQALAIIANRYDDEAPTLVTTMLSPPQIDAIDPSLCSRLADGLRIPFTGSDRRRM